MEGTTHPRTLLQPYNGPGLFITGTGTEVGKTTVAAALAAAFHRMHLRVGVCKPVASGCPKHSEAGNDPRRALGDDDYVSPDAQCLARAAGFNLADAVLMRYVSPVRLAAPVAPSVAARLEGRAIDWSRVEAAFDWWQENAQVLIVEGAGGWYVPLDEHYMIADLAATLRLPVLIVTHADLGAINQSLLTIHAIQARNLAVAGLVINRVAPSERRDLVAQTNLIELPRLSGVPLRGILLEEDCREGIPPALVDAMEDFAQSWWRLVSPA